MANKNRTATLSVAPLPAIDIVVNFGKQARDAYPKPKTLTMDALATMFSKPDLKRGTLTFAEYQALDKNVPAENRKRKDEKDGEYFVMAEFGNDGKRNEANVLYMTGFVGDLDSGLVSKSDLQERLRGLTYIAYSSYSHSLNKPVWRFIVFYKVRTAAAMHKKVYAFFQHAFEGQLDARCEHPEQLWYTPACPPDAGHHFEFFTSVGEVFDPTSVDFFASAPPTPIKPPRSSAITPFSGATHHHPLVTGAAAISEELKLASALPYINADGRDDWITIGLAIKGALGDAGEAVWTQWSKSSAKFDESAAEVTWNGLKPRDVDGVGLGTVYYMAKQQGWNAAFLSPQSQAGVTPLKPLFDIAEAKVTKFVRNPAPPRRWLLRNTLQLGKVGMLVAPGGTGKSFLAVQLAVAVATGTRLANHWEVTSPGASLVLCAEEDEEDLHHRLRDVLAATVAHSPTLQQLVEKNVHIKSMLAMNNLMTEANERREIVHTDYVDRLALSAKQIPDLRLIIIDPASRFRGGDENAAQDTTRFVEALERLRAATGATVLLIHHANKSSMSAEEVTQGASRGSSALTDGVRWQMSLSKPNKVQAKEHGVPEASRHLHILATITKNNGAPPQPPVVLVRGPGGVLDAAATARPSQSAELKLLNLIQVETAAKRHHTANGLETRFSGTSGPIGMSAAGLRKLISACVQQKYIVRRTTKPVGILELTGTMGNVPIAVERGRVTAPLS